MAGIKNLSKILESINPVLNPKRYVICSVNGELADYAHLKPIVSCVEKEGLTLFLEKQQADANNIEYQQTYQQITLTVHSSLEAVGLTAAFSNKLAEHNLSANVVAGYFHDHIFIQTEFAEQALMALKSLQQGQA